MTDDEMIALARLIGEEVEDIVKGKNPSGEKTLRARLERIRERMQSAKDKADDDGGLAIVKWF